VPCLLASVDTFPMVRELSSVTMGAEDAEGKNKGAA
jgi:hypothetical protein